MKTTRIILAFAFIIGLSACSNLDTQEYWDIEIVKNELKNLESEYSSTVDTKDIDAILKYYSDELITISPNSPILYGSEWIRTALVEMYESYELYERFSFVDIKPLGPRIVASYTYTQKMRPITEGEELVFSGKGSCVLNKSENGIWQFEWNTYTVDDQ